MLVVLFSSHSETLESRCAQRVFVSSPILDILDTPCVRPSETDGATPKPHFREIRDIFNTILFSTNYSNHEEKQIRDNQCN